ncbi:hypothetical protein D3C86_1823910 [compost metagenome]
MNGPEASLTLAPVEDEFEKLPATSPKACCAAIENPPNRPEYLIMLSWRTPPV